MEKKDKEKKVSYYRKPENMTTEEWQVALRKPFALKQEFEVNNTKDEKVFSDFLVYNPKSEKEYKVAIRSYEFGLNFCSCPDFRINGLGTCKHIEYVLHKLKEDKSNNKEWKKGYKTMHSSISLKYGNERKVF
ncbi:MAG: SWIM zinc finger domain-containing protein, partial [Draconibacterium sp.]|nr:SWIM zinc finger domain-containing protein [Draconibacterium sp.]